MTDNNRSKFLKDREFADVIKNAPLASIDLIIIDRKDRILLQYRQDRPAQGFWFVPGGRIRKFESHEDAIERISRDEIQNTFTDIKIKPNKCNLLHIYSHLYEKDNKYTDDVSMPDMKEVSTHYISIAFEYKTNRCDKDKPKLKWFTIDELLNGPDNVHRYTKDFFTKKFHTPKDSGIYSALMSHYIYYDNLFWSRTKIILAIQGAAFLGAYTTSGTHFPFPSAVMFCSAFLIFMVWLLTLRDIKNSKINEKVMDKMVARLFSYFGPSIPELRPISLRSDPISEWIGGRRIITAIIFLLIIFNT